MWSPWSDWAVRLSMIVFCMWMPLLFPAVLAAHGAGYRVTTDRRTIAMEAFYSGNEPMSYAEVMVFSPLDGKVEHQNGRTDKNGRFAFCPDAGGAWRVEISDGMGHRIDAVIEAGVDGGAGPEADTGNVVRDGTSASRSRLLEAALGLSLIVNLFLAWHACKRK